MKIPLKNQLRGPQAALAQLQDEALDILYRADPEAVLHGGTAIWRCYGGKRFSEDLDFYSQAGADFGDALAREAAKRGLTLPKFRRTANGVFAKISDGRAEVSLEASVRPKGGRILAAFERADGTQTDVYTLTREELLLEKAKAFSNRKLIRDIYDVYFLSRTADINIVRKELLSFIKSAPKPIDEKNLRTLVYSGPIPSFDEMVAALGRRALP